MPKPNRKKTTRYFIPTLQNLFGLQRRKTFRFASLMRYSTENFKKKWYKFILFLLFVWLVCYIVIGLTTRRSDSYFATCESGIHEVLPLLSEQAMNELTVQLHQISCNQFNIKSTSGNMRFVPFEWQPKQYGIRWITRLETIESIDLSLFQSLSQADDPNIELALEFLYELDSCNRETDCCFLQLIPANALRTYQHNPLNRLEKISWNRIIVRDSVLKTWVRFTSPCVFILSCFALLCPMGIGLTGIPLFDSLSDSIQLWISYLQVLCARSILYTLSEKPFYIGFDKTKPYSTFNAEWKTICLLI